jgi:hypothetical protein
MMSLPVIPLDFSGFIVNYLRTGQITGMKIADNILTGSMVKRLRGRRKNNNPSGDQFKKNI